MDDTTTQLARMVDDGCPHDDDRMLEDATDDVLTIIARARDERTTYNTPKSAARDRRPMYAALGSLLVEVAPGVYVESHRKPCLWRAENGDGFTLLLISVDKR